MWLQEKHVPQPDSLMLKASEEGHRGHGRWVSAQLIGSQPVVPELIAGPDQNRDKQGRLSDFHWLAIYIWINRYLGNQRRWKLGSPNDSDAKRRDYIQPRSGVTNPG